MIGRGFDEERFIIPVISKIAFVVDDFCAVFYRFPTSSFLRRRCSKIEEWPSNELKFDMYLAAHSSIWDEGNSYFQSC